MRGARVDQGGRERHDRFELETEAAIRNDSEDTACLRDATENLVNTFRGHFTTLVGVVNTPGLYRICAWRVKKCQATIRK